MTPWARSWFFKLVFDRNSNVLIFNRMLLAWTQTSTDLVRAIGRPPHARTEQSAIVLISDLMCGSHRVIPNIIPVLGCFFGSMLHKILNYYFWVIRNVRLQSWFWSSIWNIAWTHFSVSAAEHRAVCVVSRPWSLRKRGEGLLCLVCNLLILSVLDCLDHLPFDLLLNLVKDAFLFLGLWLPRSSAELSDLLLSVLAVSSELAHVLI